MKNSFKSPFISSRTYSIIRNHSVNEIDTSHAFSCIHLEFLHSSWCKKNEFHILPLKHVNFFIISFSLIRSTPSHSIKIFSFVRWTACGILDFIIVLVPWNFFCNSVSSTGILVMYLSIWTCETSGSVSTSLNHLGLNNSRNYPGMYFYLCIPQNPKSG